MSDVRPQGPPPIPIRRRDVAVRYLRLGEIAEAVRAGAYRIPCELVAAALRRDADAHSRGGTGGRGAP